ncbi:transposase [Candidatus Palauibacter sp.]|uniref:transposase n=1 Tax=Candidatus Palauibacter sp. TaxID=3101350 RepID=UPI003D11EF70
MAGRRGRYPPEYRERLVELAKSGRSPPSPAREFEPSERTIRDWVRRADLTDGSIATGRRRRRAASCGAPRTTSTRCWRVPAWGVASSPSRRAAPARSA